MMLALSLFLLAQAADPPKPEPQGEIPAVASIHSRKKPGPHLQAAEGHLTGAGPEVMADDVVDEMVDEFAADVARFGAAQLGPILLQKVRVSDNMNPAFAGILEARLAAAMGRAANVAMVRCIECNATRSRVENAEWVVTRGITTREQAQAIARKYGARSYLDVAFTLRPSSVSMEVEMVRAADGSIAYAEAYRMDADKALLYRGADRAQTREERIKDLEDRINQHPRWGQTVEFGAMMIPATSGWAAGGLGRFQIAEEFGEQRQHHAGFSVAGFLNTGSLAGGIVSAIWQMRLGDNNIFVPQWWLGLSAGAFLTGAPGNTPIFGATLRWLPGQRFSLHGALNYMIPFQLHGKGDNFGGLVPEVGVGFVWN